MTDWLSNFGVPVLTATCTAAVWSSFAYVVRTLGKVGGETTLRYWVNNGLASRRGEAMGLLRSALSTPHAPSDEDLDKLVRGIDVWRAIDHECLALRAANAMALGEWDVL